MVECPNCKKQLDDGMNFCDSCGTPLPKIINCPTCGTPMSKDLSNCPNCGAVNTEKNAVMGAPVPAPAPTPTPVAPTPVAPTPVTPTPAAPTPAAPVQESGTISSGTISSGTISSGTISSGTISSGTISSGTISSGTIQSGTIGQSEPPAQPLGQTSFNQPEPQATPLQSEPFGQPQGQPMGQQNFGQPQYGQQQFGQPQQQWGAPQGQPAYGQPPMGQQWGEPAPKKKKTGLIIGIIIAVIVLVVGGVFAFLFFTKQGPFKDAVLEQLKEAEVGQIITYGKYEQDNDTSNGKEDIQWKVLAKEDGKILVLAEKAIEGQQFNSTKEATTWEKCTLRSFLNSTFISEAFEGNYQSRIVESTVNADKNPSKSSVAQGNSTQDKVFILSYSEMSKYMTSNEARKCYITDYAYSKGAWKGDSGEACCWLRTMGTMDTTYQNATIVQGAGSLGANGRPVNEVQSVRPAMWISIQ